jgi:Fungal specific transcription factor domain
MLYARQEAAGAFLNGPKRVETVQAFYLLSLYPIPPRRWEEDRSWIYLGQAVRVAQDMNLHHPNTATPRNELHAREMLNRTRAWLNVFNLDRSLGSQYGKMSIIGNTDYVANHSHGWWNSSEYNIEHFDVHLCAYNAELRVLSGFLTKVYSNPEHPTGLNKVGFQLYRSSCTLTSSKEIDLGRLATETDDNIEQMRMHWFSKLEQTDINDPQNRFRIGLLKLAYSYARLVALAFGFQHAFGKSNTDENPFLKRVCF